MLFFLSFFHRKCENGNHKGIANSHTRGESMKLRLIGILAGLLLLIGCSGKTPEITGPESYHPSGDMARLGVQVPGGVDDIRLISMTPRIRLGAAGRMTIQGKPGVRYSITATYRIQNDTVSAYETRTAGADGIVIWTWAVNFNTAPGRYPITVSGGGRTLNTSYTVVT